MVLLVLVILLLTITNVMLFVRFDRRSCSYAMYRRKIQIARLSLGFVYNLISWETPLASRYYSNQKSSAQTHVHLCYAPALSSRHGRLRLTVFGDLPSPSKPMALAALLTSLLLTGASEGPAFISLPMNSNRELFSLKKRLTAVVGVK
ncbi:hypothetical protein BDN71DRAFT_1159585 [Pleurotus eryngii]|uniref:Uncharacterized protein n=1 Tax=Pleurotus eryngii TaxID=5323 RepID=A0A9P5ZR79_PLEER|nr:hypothetical protein BDN71DRAFT_1159585 [Pleurotus eryngii]